MGGKAVLDDQLAPKAVRALHMVADQLEKYGIKYCLESGTLLGIVREGRLLPWDNDLDLFVDSADVDKLDKLKWPLFIRGFLIKKYRVKEDFGPLRRGNVRILKIKSWRLFKKDKQRLLIDLFVKYPDAERYYWSVGKRHIVNKSVPRHHYDTLSSIEFDGRIFPIPSEIDDYLTRRYGNWTTPVQQWDFKVDDQAVHTD